MNDQGEVSEVEEEKSKNEERTMLYNPFITNNKNPKVLTMTKFVDEYFRTCKVPLPTLKPEKEDHSVGYLDIDIPRTSLHCVTDIKLHADTSKNGS